MATGMFTTLVPLLDIMTLFHKGPRSDKLRAYDRFALHFATHLTHQIRATAHPLVHRRKLLPVRA